jgi:hypothetical protein
MAELTDVFYGLCTFWTDDWKSLARDGVPCCPFCGAPGFEMDKAMWWQGIRAHEAKGNAGYVAMMEWAKGRCFPNYGVLKVAYDDRGT